MLSDESKKQWIEMWTRTGLTEEHALSVLDQSEKLAALYAFMLRHNEDIAPNYFTARFSYEADDSNPDSFAYDFTIQRTSGLSPDERCKQFEEKVASLEAQLGLDSDEEL